MTTSNPDFIYFESQLPLLLKEHRNQFALVKNSAIHGIYPTYEAALQAGYAAFSHMDFLVQEITDEKRTNYHCSSTLR